MCLCMLFTPQVVTTAFLAKNMAVPGWSIYVWKHVVHACKCYRQIVVYIMEYTGISYASILHCHSHYEVELCSGTAFICENSSSP